MATIAFDAKRAFANSTGLGNYSRSLIDALSRFYPGHDYLLLTPYTRRNLCEHLVCRDNIRVRMPPPPLAAKAGPLWRRYGLSRVLRREGAHVYHGLSHELPLGIEKSGVFSVVTIHDMLPFRYPKLFKWPDRSIYQKKFRHACFSADRIIAVSAQTRDDIFQYLDPKRQRITEDKVMVVYQGCDPVFHDPPGLDQARARVLEMGVEGEYVLSVGAIIERKNLLSLVKGMEMLLRGGEGKTGAGTRGAPASRARREPQAWPGQTLKLVVVGTGRSYETRVREYVRAKGLDEVVLFLGQVGLKDLPHLYRAAQVFVYPSMYEGFGIPIIEAQHCFCPVITSTGSCFPEVGGPHSLYVETRDAGGPERIARALRELLGDQGLAETIRQEGKGFVKRFDPTIVAKGVMGVYGV